MPDYRSHETSLLGEDVVLSKRPEIMGNVVYRFGFRITGSPRDFNVEITDVEVQEIKSPVYNESGNPIHLNEEDKQKFVTSAYNYFWKYLLSKAEEKAIDQVRWGL